MLVKLNQATTQNGFTLVEVLTVMLVLVAIASVTIEVSSDLAFQNRYEVTKDRYEKIKRAIIGRPDVLINGQPDISGFVADMGRLPNNIRELLDKTYCLPDRTIDETNFDDITYGSAQLHCDGVYGANSWQILDNNWEGPYLTITKSVTDPAAFVDGWGNTPTDYCTDLTKTDQSTCTSAGETWVTAAENHNFGWYFYVDTSASPNQLHLFSLGKDQQLNGSNYDKDYPNSENHPNEPAVLQANDWTVPLPQLSVSMQSPEQNTFNCSTYGVTESSCKNTANWNWFGQPECRDFSNLTTSHDTETSCTTAGNTWYWITSWPIEFCADNTKTTEATCIAASSTWYKSLCSDSTSTNLQSCIDASGTWSSEWPAGDARCTNRYYTSQSTCENAGHRWLIPFCTDLTSSTKAACASASKKWVISFCSSGNSLNQSACLSASGLWGGCIDNTNSKNFCDSNGGIWLSTSKNISVEITYPSDTGGLRTILANAVIQENGQYQQILFNNDNDGDGIVFFEDMNSDGIEDGGDNDITELPQTTTSTTILVQSTNDIYPPSCSGLNSDTNTGDAFPSDCEKIGGTKLNNGLCGDVTISECLTGTDGTKGTLLRNTLQLPIVTHKALPIINW